MISRCRLSENNWWKNGHSMMMASSILNLTNYIEIKQSKISKIKHNSVFSILVICIAYRKKPSQNKKTHNIIWYQNLLQKKTTIMDLLFYKKLDVVTSTLKGKKKKKFKRVTLLNTQPSFCNSDREWSWNIKYKLCGRWQLNKKAKILFEGS